MMVKNAPIILVAPTTGNYVLPWEAGPDPTASLTPITPLPVTGNYALPWESGPDTTVAPTPAIPWLSAAFDFTNPWNSGYIAFAGA